MVEKITQILLLISLLTLFGLIVKLLINGG